MKIVVLAGGISTERDVSLSSGRGVYNALKERGHQVIRHTIALAHDLGMEVLAEGVEEKEQVDILKGMDCDEIQGFYYSRPLPYEEFCKMEISR